MESDRAYFMRRAAEERAAAVSASHPGARRSHIEMADRYDELATAMGDYEGVAAADPMPNRRS